MKLIFLGTGTSQGTPIIGCNCNVCTSNDPKDKRTRTSALIIDQNTTILIDASPDLRWQFLNFYNHRKLDAVLITHEHRDHVGGLDDLRPIIFHQQKPMPIYALQRTLDAIKCIFFYSFQEDRYPGAPEFQLIPVNFDKPFKINHLEIIPIRVNHYKFDILGFRIGKLTYITDAKKIYETELPKIKDTEILVINALRRKPHYSHFNLDEALQFIQLIKPKKAYLTHMGHFIGKHQDLLKELPPNVKPAYDGLVVEIN